MTFNLLLDELKIDLTTVMVLRHRPTEPQLRKVFPWLAAEKPQVFNAYQQNQGEKVEKAMQKAKFVASFIGNAPGKATFVGLYELHGCTPMAVADCELLQEVIELHSHGMGPLGGESKRTSVLWFDLRLTPHIADWKGKLIVEWPGQELSWWRWADKNTFKIHAIREESAFDAQLPQWDQLILTWGELQLMPTRLKLRLEEWRGIYYIFDKSIGKGYVGSAYGSENILGRWLQYATSGHGGNQLLKKQDPQHFHFSILQRLSPDSTTEVMIHCENTWKERLHTRSPNGLNDN